MSGVRPGVAGLEASGAVIMAGIAVVVAGATMSVCVCVARRCRFSSIDCWDCSHCSCRGSECGNEHSGCGRC